MNIAKRRNPYVQLILYPAQVQGEGAKESIVRGIEMLERKAVDVMIVGRGGGSIEDLWAFNEEEVARAIFNCRIPVISAVGHETDTTIADYAADLRAPTPSAAAELAVFDYYQTESLLEEYRQKLRRVLHQKLLFARMCLEKYETKLKFLHPGNKLREDRMRLSELEDRLRGQMQEKLERSRQRLAIYIEKMNGLSPLGKLSKGYAYVQTEAGKALTSIRQIKEEDRICIYVTDGMIHARAEEIKEERHG